MVIHTFCVWCLRILRNAWKYTSKQDSARISLGSVESDGRLAYFVRDNGVGFDMAYADKLFGEQYLNGKVGFSSSEDEGTTFWVELRR